MDEDWATLKTYEVELSGEEETDGYQQLLKLAAADKARRGE